MEEEELIFEEDEVIWAKIRGYPWWPAYVSPILRKISQLHTLGNKEYEYTVVFFGDNTKVDGTKVKKFIENYIEFYLKAKTHRKLMSSIMMAEEKLKQNDQNVQIFQDFRNKIKDRRPRGRPREGHQSNSHFLESQGVKNSHRGSEHQIYQEIEQSNNKKDTDEDKIKAEKDKDSKISTPKDELGSVQKSNERMEAQQNIDDKMMQEEEDEQSQKINFPQKNRKIQQKEQNSGRKPSISRQVDIVIDNRGMHEGLQNKIQVQVIKQTEQKIEKVDKTDKAPGKRGRKKKQEKNSTEMGIKTNQNEKENQETEKNKTEPIPGSEGGKSIEKQQEGQAEKKIKKEVMRPQGRKRGRPPKKIQVTPKPLSDEEQFSEIGKPESAPAPKKKIIKKPALVPLLKQPEKSKGMSMADKAVIAGVERLLNNREGLIDFLSRSTITVENVKQILDMDVSQILQEGTITDQVVHLLQLLRAALLFKYFPDDIKHKKKYQKLLKRKHIEPEQEQEDDEKELSREKVEIRKKTSLKVKKFVSTEGDNEFQNQQIAEKIENEIFAADNWVGQKYCKIAFLVLTALKERKETWKQILEKLQKKGYE